MSVFLSMGGYATYVRPAYLVAALGLSGLTVLSLRALYKARRTQAQFSKTE